MAYLDAGYTHRTDMRPGGSPVPLETLDPLYDIAAHDDGQGRVLIAVLSNAPQVDGSDLFVVY